MDVDDNSNFSEDDLAVTVKLLAYDSEVRCITGENDSILKHIRKQSGASISISEGSVQDRIIIITGTLEEMYDACKLIILRLEVWYVNETSSNAKDPAGLIVRLIVPAMQCGPLIGKGGSKIKELRDSTGASLQVAADILPNSSERIVNISGQVDSILDCIYEICLILLSTPQKISPKPYRPISDCLEGPIVFSDGKAYTLHGSSAVPIADLEFLYKNDLMKSFFGLKNPSDYSMIARLLKSRSLNRDPNEKRQNFIVQEMKIPDDAAWMFGKHNTKGSEIRQITGAIITLSNVDDRSSSAREKLITIEGTPEGVTLAKYLVNASIELRKMNPDGQLSLDQYDSLDLDSATTSLSNSLTQPGAMNVLSNLVGFQNVTEFLSSFESGRRY